MPKEREKQPELQEQGQSACSELLGQRLKTEIIQKNALNTVVEWLEQNGHGEDERKKHNGELHLECYACKIIDMCKNALRA